MINTPHDDSAVLVLVTAQSLINTPQDGCSTSNLGKEPIAKYIMLLFL
jgi:hypothetical protein